MNKINKIDKLTAAQQRQLIEYREKWLAIGRSTEPADRPKAEAAISEFYGLLHKTKPLFLWWDGPATGSLARAVLAGNLGENLRDNLRDNIGENLGNLRNNLGENLRKNLRNNLRANLGENLWANLGENLWNNLGENLRNNLDWYFWGQHEAYWPAYYAFPHEYLRPIHSDEQLIQLRHWIALAQSCGWWEPFEKVVFICERPAKQIVNASGKLHCESGPALLCRDGWPVYALNGVRVQEKHVMRPAEDIPATEVLLEQNVEVRRELIRKIGIERFIHSAGAKTLNKVGDYELLSVDLSADNKNCRYLKMLNPSIGIWHVEGVPNDCQTVEHALNSRKPEQMRAIPISEDGENWYQQGDVCCWPADAKALKPLPTQIT